MGHDSVLPDRITAWLGLSDNQGVLNDTGMEMAWSTGLMADRFKEEMTLANLTDEGVPFETIAEIIAAGGVELLEAPGSAS